MIRFQCPGCRLVLQVPASMGGSVVACTRCPQRFRVPAVRLAPPPLPPRPAVRVVKEAPADDDLVVRPPRRVPRHPGSGLGSVVAIVLCLFLVVSLAGGMAFVLWGRVDVEAEKQPAKPPRRQAKALPGDRPAPKEEAPPPGPPAAPALPQEPPPKKDGTVKSPPLPVVEAEPTLPGRVLATINVRRIRAGLAAVTLDEALCRACREHARYLTLNLSEHPDLDPHAQDAALPGSSEAGRAVARRASILRAEPAQAVKTWLEAPGHRDLLLAADLRSIGLAFHGNERDGWLSVFDLLGGRPAQPPGGAPGYVLYPAPRQTNVPLPFPGNEVPDPLPALRDKLAGFPVTVTFHPLVRVRAAAARLEDESGRDVPIWFSSPDQPANEQHARNQQNTLCLFAHKPLRPGTRYLVRMQARLGEQDWSRTWTFTTVGADRTGPLMNRRALDRLNEIRKWAGLKPVRLDAEGSKACAAHAAYLARHLDRTPDLRVNDEREDLAGFTPAGRDMARHSGIRLGGGAGPHDAIDWILASVLNRHLALNPATQTVALGAAQQSPRGWIWVVGLSPNWRRDPAHLATLYPGKDQTDVPLYFGREVDELVPGQPKDHVAGFAITANFFPRAKVRRASARLLGPEGKKIDCWMSSPEKPLPGTGNYAQVLLVPKQALAAATTYTAAFSAVVDGREWSETWRFTTIDVDGFRARVAQALRERVNEVRKQAGLPPVTLDEGLSRGCLAHARYVGRNLDNPKVQGLRIHEEDPSLPGATPEGGRAGKASVIAVLPDPLDSVEGWMATLYHRIPLLDPALKRIGYGHDMHHTRGWVTVLDVLRGR